MGSEQVEPNIKLNLHHSLEPSSVYHYGGSRRMYGDTSKVVEKLISS